ncbi:hypothetical protein EAE96_010902 [Botrytis aclada]|nr:hypothetical protein EAE96_010902 [Botrytis aclada]
MQIAGDHVVREELESSSSTTTWLDYTTWPTQFADRPLQILVNTASLPARNCRSDYMLGTWKNSDLKSRKSDELKICRLLRAFDRVIQRCHSTLKVIPELLRCWLETFTLTGFYPKPFTPLSRPATFRQYQRYWRQFLYFVFRTWRIEPAIRDQVYGIRFSFTQQALISQIWELLEQKEGEEEGDEEEEEEEEEESQDNSENDFGDSSEDDEEYKPESGLKKDCKEEREGFNEGFVEVNSQDSDSGSASLVARHDVIAERLFQLSCAFWTDISPTGTTSHLPLVYFSGILGIQAQGLAFRTPYLYTTVLAGLVYIGRLLLLEYALPQHAYRTLGWPDRSICPNYLERLQLVRKKYLCRGGSHPMSRLLELLWQGRSITKKEGARANISWSADSQVLTLQLRNTHCQISTSQLRATVWVTIQDCQIMLHQLMFNWKPVVSLERIEDSLANNQPGWSFLTEPSNRLGDSYRQLSEQAWMSKDGLRVGEKWSRPRSENYLQLAMKFGRLLQVCIHFVGGMPGRMTEIASIRYRNTRQVMRNIFVHNGKLAIITEYHKARSRTNHAFYVVRILPQLVSQMLFQYLVYIQPFTRSLAYQVQAGFSPSPTPVLGMKESALAFCTPQGTPWTADQISPIIKDQTQKTSGASLGVAAYRQVVIAIAKRHLSSIEKPFNIYSSTASMSHYPWIGIARQSGHTPQALATSYAIDEAYPTRLQPELIRQYEIMSALWHEWLNIDQLEAELRVKQGTPIQQHLRLESKIVQQPRPTQAQQPLPLAQVVAHSPQKTSIQIGKRRHNNSFDTSLTKRQRVASVQVKALCQKSALPKEDRTVHSSVDKQSGQERAPKTTLATPPPPSPASVYVTPSSSHNSRLDTNHPNEKPPAHPLQSPTYKRAQFTLFDETSYINQGRSELDQLLDNPWI